MESDRLLEELLNHARRQTRLLEEIRDLFEALRAGDGGTVPVGGAGEDRRDLA